MKTKSTKTKQVKKTSLLGIHQWPIVIQDGKRAKLVSEIIEFTSKRYIQLDNDTLESIINKSIYLEKQRIKLDPWKVDPPNEIVFWNKAKKKLDQSLLIEDKSFQKEKLVQIIQKIIKRYAEEIVGNFNIDTFYFARKFLTLFFKGIFGRFSLLDFFRLQSAKKKCLSHFKVSGDYEKVKELFNHGTVVILPTHSSNLDSILIGFMLDQVSDLPAFSYGAGLNLYNNSLAAFYMNRLGAYRVDRRKKNPIYLDSLKNMSSISIEEGTNTIFFPGGTRSRDGMIETKLKLGLMGSVIDAQRSSLQHNLNNKIFIVPLVVSYDAVLEAGMLIEQHLKRTGKEQYSSQIKRKWNFLKIMQFARNILFKKSNVYFSFGEPMDVIGNVVNSQGESIDKYGNKIDIKSYFELQGIVDSDEQRESEYTKLLGKKVGESFLKLNQVLPIHLVCFTIVNLLKEKFNTNDIFDILKYPATEWNLEYDKFKEACSEALTLIQVEAKQELFKIPEIMQQDLNKILEYAMNFGGSYHVIKPINLEPKKNIVSVRDLPIVIFYHNRIVGYELEQKLKWQK